MTAPILGKNTITITTLYKRRYTFIAVDVSIIDMTSTQQLSIGSKYALPELKARWLKINHDNGFQVQVLYNTKTNFASICYKAPKKGWKDDTGCRAQPHKGQLE